MQLRRIAQAAFARHLEALPPLRAQMAVLLGKLEDMKGAQRLEAIAKRCRPRLLRLGGNLSAVSGVLRKSCVFLSRRPTLLPPPQ